MDDWKTLDPLTLTHPYERLRWARLKAGYKTASDGAKAAGKTNPGTYRSHERRPEEEGRVIDEHWAQLYGEAFGVYWPWLLAGEGTPYMKYVPENPVDRRWQELPLADRKKALDLLDIAKSNS